jgi:processive 1,2-diacylglycerol beta-glucosyltransferase
METPGHPRILILSASVGSGHIRAAAAIESALAQIAPEAAVTNVDVLQLTNNVFRRAYGAGYFRAAQRTPNLVGMMYDYLDRPIDGRFTTRARLAFERLNFTRLHRLLTDQPWDLAINTHFLPSHLIARLCRNQTVLFPQVTVVTDFDVHGMWIHDSCERYFLATEEGKANVVAGGVPAEKAVVTGIPIDPRFAEPRDRTEIIRRLGLSTDRPIILQMAGKFGVGSAEKIHQMICDVEHPLQIITVTGKNADAKESLLQMDCHPRHYRRILGYSNQMHDLLAAADIVGTKPGGLTTSECLASGCAMIVVEPIPGQEDRNADYVLENGCAIKVNNLASLTYKLNSLLSDPQKLQRMRAAALQCARPRAAFDIAAQCVELVESRASAAWRNM